MRNTIFATAITLLIMGCSEAPPPGSGQIRVPIAEQLNEIAAMTNAGHSAEVMSSMYLNFFSANPAVLPYGGDLLSGRDEVSDFYARVFSMGALVSNAYTEPTIEIAEGFVVRIYEGTAEIRLYENNELLRYTNVYTDVLVAEDGVWKIRWHSWVPAPVYP